MARTLDFYFDLVSPYSYLAATQVEALADRCRVELRWRPFLLGAVFKATGNQAPIANPHKGAYMLRDLARWARHYGLPAFTFPAPFPFNPVRLDRLALVAFEHGKGPAFVRHAFAASFAEGRDVQQDAEVRRLLERAGLDPEGALARAEASEIKDRLRRNTEDALAAGAFGAPAFVVDGELYWGNDRLMLLEHTLKQA